LGSRRYEADQDLTATTLLNYLASWFGVYIISTLEGLPIA
jgi:hypothetical protein